jgi:hypothetical protein
MPRRVVYQHGMDMHVGWHGTYVVILTDCILLLLLLLASCSR